MEKKKIIFVCTGNTCRSVMAKHLFRKMLDQRIEENPAAAGTLGDIEVSSAGIAPIPGMNTVPGTVKALMEEGLDASEHRSRRLTPGDVRGAKLVLVMEKNQVEEVLRIAGEGAEKVRHVNSFLPGGGQEDIPDPFGRSMEFYIETRERLRRGLEKLLEKLENGEI